MTFASDDAEVITLRLTRAQAWALRAAANDEWASRYEADKRYTETRTRRPRGWRKALAALEEALTALEQAMECDGEDSHV